MDTSPGPGPSCSASGAALQHPRAVAWRQPWRVATATKPSLSIPPTPLPWSKLCDRKIPQGGGTKNPLPRQQEQAGQTEACLVELEAAVR